MRKILNWILISILILILVSCSNNNTTQNINEDEIIIGTLGPFTGNVAEYGLKMKYGIEQAIEEINENGGICNKKVKLISYDTEGDATKAVDLFNRLIENDNAKFILGPCITSECNAVSEIAEENKIPMITPTGTGTNITKDKDYVFRICFTDAYQGILMGKYTADELKVKTAAIIYNNASDYSIGLAKAFKEKAESMGVKITNYETYTTEDKDFSAIVTNVNKNKPEAIFLPDYYGIISNIITQFKKTGQNSIFLGGDGWDGAAVEFAKDVEGGLFVSHFSPKDTDKEVQDFIKNYKNKFNEEPNSFSALGYDSAYVLKKAIENADSFDGDSVIKALKNINVDTICSDDFSFDSDGNPLNKKAPIQEYKDLNVKFIKKISGN